MIYPFNAAEVFKIAIEIEENGRQFYEKALAMGRNLSDRDVERRAWHGLGCLFYYRRDLEEAVYFLESALKIAREGRDRRPELESLRMLGNTFVH